MEERPRRASTAIVLAIALGLLAAAGAVWAVVRADDEHPEVEAIRATRSGISVPGGQPSPDQLQARVPLPEITATRDDREFVVHYRFANFPNDPFERPAILIVSADSAGSRVPPVTVRHRIERPEGTIRQPLGIGEPPFEILVSVQTVADVRSAGVARTPLR